MSDLLRPLDLHCEYRRDPLGIDVRTPRLGWALAGGGRDAVQAAYRIQVGSAPGLADAWDSGRVAGDAQLAIAYAGAPLRERTRYHWRVQVWDGAGREGPWSASAWFETAFLDAAGFAGAWLTARAQGDDERSSFAGARWIAAQDAPPEPLLAFAASVTLPADAVVAHARFQAMHDGHPNPWGCGVYRYLSINGQRPDSCDHCHAQMDADVTALLKPGANQVVVRTWNNAGAAVMVLLTVVLADGRTIALTTNPADWRCRGLAKDAPHGTWDDPAAAGFAPVRDVGAFGAGPWPADDRRNRFDRMIPALVLRRALTIAKPVARARIYATACGVYELVLGGVRVGDRVLAPGWTDYTRRIHYQTYDVTDLLKPGDHELLATVGDGWWCGHLAPPFGLSFYGNEKALKLALHLDYADGSSAVIASETADWQAGTGPVRASDLLNGQITDLTREPGGWRVPTVATPPAGRMMAQPDEPVRRLFEYPARSLTELKPGTVVVDFGQNLVGAVRLRLRAPRGTRLRIRHAEVLDLKGGLFTDALRSAQATDEHICSGDDDDILPAFTFHGFRYAEISGLPGGLTMDQVTAVVYGTDTPDRGTFTCDDPLLNRLQANIRWGQRGNFLSIPTDCPQRDERLGWTADTQVFVRTAAHNADCASFYGKYVQDMLDAQHADGGFPDFAPTNKPIEKARYGWADAGVIIPWWLWRLYGDLDTARAAWDGMRRYVDHRDAGAVDDLNTVWSFGDWVSPPPQTPNEVLGPVYHAWMHRLMAELAQALGRSADVAHHQRRFAAIGDAWRRKHLASDGRIHSSDTQAAYACALRAGLIPAALLPAVGRHFAASVQRHGWHLNTGFLGTYCLLPALTQIGRDDIAWRILTARTYPGWLYTVLNGATTMWERWNGYSPETGPANIGGMNSYNHYAFGAVGEWMYAAIGGLDRAEDDVAFQHLVIRPVPGGHCRQASTAYRSARGTVSSRWWIDGTRFELRVAVPPNCTAEVHVPTTQGGAVGGDGAKHLRDTPTHAVFAVGAGEWSFSAPA